MFVRIANIYIYMWCDAQKYSFSFWLRAIGSGSFRTLIYHVLVRKLNVWFVFIENRYVYNVAERNFWEKLLKGTKTSIFPYAKWCILNVYAGIILSFYLKLGITYICMFYCSRYLINYLSGASLMNIIINYNLPCHPF